MLASILTNLSTSLTNLKTKLVKVIKKQIVEETITILAGVTKIYDFTAIIGAGNLSKYDLQFVNYSVMVSTDNISYVNYEYWLTVTYDVSGKTFSLRNDSSGDLFVKIVIDVERV